MRRCGRALDPCEHHAHACPGNPGIRHDRLGDLPFSLLDASSFHVLLEQEEPALRHRTDLRLDSGLALLMTYLEVHVVHPAAPSADHTRNSQSSDAAATQAWIDKLRHDYEPLPDRMPFRLVPSVATSFGSLHPASSAFLREYVQRVAESVGSLPGSPHVAAALLARCPSTLSIGLWKQSVAMLRRCVPALGAKKAAQSYRLCRRSL